jgi:flagellar protein FlbD
MIELVKLNGMPVFVNPDLIRFLESTPDTILSFTDGEKLMVKNKPQEIVEKIVNYRRLVLSGPEIKTK